MGCCLLDIGGGTTELVVFVNGMLRHAAAIPVGGDHFTNDLAVGLRTPIPEAEKIKRAWLRFNEYSAMTRALRLAAWETVPRAPSLPAC